MLVSCFVIFSLLNTLKLITFLWRTSVVYTIGCLSCIVSNRESVCNKRRRWCTLLSCLLFLFLFDLDGVIVCSDLPVSNTYFKLFLYIFLLFVFRFASFIFVRFASVILVILQPRSLHTSSKSSPISPFSLSLLMLP